MNLVERDLAVLWHPASHFSDHDRLPPLAIDRARGCELITTDGRRIIDAISSWWTCLHGHGHPQIIEAIQQQTARLDHVMLAGFTHEAAVSLAETLLTVAPPGFGRVFYADCGSAAVEVALKLSFQSRQQRGEANRQRFATLQNSYHGETCGALAVSASDVYRNRFASLLPSVVYLPAPNLDCHEHAALAEDAGADSPEADEAVAILEASADELTALIVEPLVQCAGKMTMTGSGYYKRVAQKAQSLGIHVIADEIAVAFGRTGRLFASTWSEVTPDLLCLSKGLSGGVLPLACVLIRSGFENDFRGDPSRSFLHSHTFTGNPIACAAGIASLRLVQTQRLPRLPAQIGAMEELQRDVARRCEGRVVSHRQAGLIAAFDLAPSIAQSVPGGRVSLAIREEALSRGVLLRPLHDTVYWMPPLTIEQAELEKIADTTVEAILAVAT